MKLGVLLLQMGSPSGPQAVRSYLYRLFSDRAILPLPFPARQVLAGLIAAARARKAQTMYAKMAWPSPLLTTTFNQAKALQASLSASIGGQAAVRCEVGMRYSAPSIQEAAATLAQWQAERIVLLPMYPQYATVTTGSALAQAEKELRAAGFSGQCHALESYPDLPGWIRALAAPTWQAYRQALAFGAPRVLFSAHALPERTVAKGDPYPAHCARTATALRHALGIESVDSALCYQSRLGPMAWTGPSLAQMVDQAARQRRPIVVTPISFTTDNLETLVEIDQQTRARAATLGAPFFACVKIPGTDPVFIQALAKSVEAIAFADKN